MNPHYEKVSSNPEMIHTIKNLLDEASRSFPTDLACVKQCLSSASEMLRFQESIKSCGTLDGNPVAGGLATWQLLRIKEVIGAALGRRLTTPYLASVVRLSPGHFSRAFRRSVGETPRCYIMKLRLVRAKEIMATTDQPISEIALTCGLADQAHLSRMFRRFEGESPNAWRRRSKVAPRIPTA